MFNDGQHISFYTTQTLQNIADKLDLHFQTNNGVHCFSCHPLNSFLFKVCTSNLGSAVMRNYVRKRMKSLTFSDHKVLIKESL